MHNIRAKYNIEHISLCDRCKYYRKSLFCFTKKFTRNRFKIIFCIKRTKKRKKKIPNPDI